ncbi:ferritin [Kutzneria viridogrisea]|uniref:Ferritin n=2 Tax=Kutzneria TaxID=43356 RepID=W5VYG3_9PSEU|nr:ferritin [Kutzneria albida]AHH93485.1 putative bacterioferritin BfrB [Kutzneria albida DSM 43870]MBA8929129.1 ferritin [Kutzneria viridogrisea]
MSPHNGTTKFHELLRAQIRNEFTAAQQYTAIAVWFDGQDLPRLAAHFYRQSLEERNHAMMIVQYLLDNDITVAIPGVGEVRNEFDSVREPVELALQQERTVTDEITTLARAARDEGDYLGEQFMQWFLKEQVEEVSSMSTLLHTVDRAGDNVFHIEDFLARESVGEEGNDPTAPKVAGGKV